MWIRLILIFFIASTAQADYEPSGPRSYYNADVDSSRIATGGPVRNYYDGSIWRKINPDFRLVSGDLVSDSGYHEVTADLSTNILWLDWNGHILGIEVGKLFAYRKSIDQRYPIADPDFSDRSFSGAIITINNIYPNVTLEIENRTGHLRHRFIFHQAARVAFEQWWQDNGQHDDIYLVNTFRLYVGQLNCNWRDQIGDFDLSVDRDITRLVELRYQDAAEFFLGDEKVKLSTGPVNHTPIYKRVMLIGGNPYLAEGFKWADVREWPAGDISHNATFGETDETETGSRVIVTDHVILSKQTMGGTGGTLDSIYAFVHANWSVDSMLFCIYNASDSSLLAQAAAKILNETVSGTFSWWGDAVSASVSASTDYWIGYNSSNGNSAFNYINASGGTANDDTDALPLADPFAGGNPLTNQFSIYGVYTEAGAATSAQVIIIGGN